MTASLLQKIFIASLFGLIIAGCVLFYFASQFLRETAIETDRVKTDITLIRDDLEKLARLETEMKEKSDIIARAQQIVSDSTSFQHQDQIIQDVNAYASIAGVQIGGFSFTPESSTTSPGSTSPGTAPSSGPVVIPGVKTLEATVTLTTPIKYDNFLRFIVAIEQNLTKMQITGVNMSPAEGDPTSISNPTIGLLIYVKG